VLCKIDCMHIENDKLQLLCRSDGMPINTNSIFILHYSRVYVHEQPQGL
jgi:hypothetical protein